MHIDGNDNKIILGNDVSVVDGRFWIEDSNNEISIGDKSSLCGDILLAACEGTSIQIGIDTLCSSHIEIRTSDSHAIFNDSGIRINTAKDVEIGNHVWIGTGVKINKGVSVGNNCVIGNGTIITKPILESNVIIAGIPGKICKSGINWSRYR